ncbi:MAG: inositol monophosphatase family protein, partial [Pseudomonadota bacterium]
AALGAGATLNGAAIAHSGCAAPEGAVVLGGRPVMRAEHWPGGVPPLRRVWRSSLAWRLCLVADGAFDAALSVRGTWEWDVAAGSLIAAEAGAAVSDSTGRALLFNRQPPRHDGVFVAPPALHATLLAHRLGPAGTGNGGSGQGGSDQGGPGRGRR